MAEYKPCLARDAEGVSCELAAGHHEPHESLRGLHSFRQWEEYEPPAPAPADPAPLQALVARWRDKVQRFRHDAHFVAASVWIEDCADELDTVLAAIAKAEGR